MRIIKKSTLVSMYNKFPESKNQLLLWESKIRTNSFQNCSEIKEFFKQKGVRCIGQNRVIFNICRNKYRLIGHINYKHQIVYICFLDTHENYEKIDAKDVWQH